MQAQVDLELTRFPTVDLYITHQPLGELERMHYSAVDHAIDKQPK